MLSLSLSLVTGYSESQTQFTIIQPADEAIVRESVPILFPRASVHKGAIVALMVDDVFLDFAVSVNQTGGGSDPIRFDWSTREVPDGAHKLAAFLYERKSADTGYQMVASSTASITVANHSSISVPVDGFKLRYNPTQDRTYRYSIRRTEETQLQFGLGATRDDKISIPVKPFVDLPPVSFDKKSNGDLVVFIPRSENFAEYEGRITSTGRVQTNYSAQDDRNFMIFSTLPSRGVKPGDVWSVNFMGVTGRGEMLGLEWPNGHPCARIRNSVVVAGPAMRIELSQIVSYGLDVEMPVKVVTKLKTDFLRDKDGPPDQPQVHREVTTESVLRNVR